MRKISFCFTVFVILAQAGCNWVGDTEVSEEKTVAKAAKIIEMPPLRRSVKPIPFAKNTTTMAKENEEYWKWTERYMLDYYNKKGARSAAWDADAVEFLKLCARFTTKFKVNEGKIMGLANRLVTSGCRDPYVLYLAGNIFHHHHKLWQALSLVEPAVNEFKKPRYPKLFAYFAVRRRNNIHKCLRVSVPPEEQEEQFRLLARASGDDIFKGEGRRFYIRFLNDEIYRERDTTTLELYNIIARELKAMKNADPWTLNYIQGVLEVKLAWQCRGSSYAAGVTRSGWRGFAEHLRAAARHLRKAHSLRPDFPFAADEMISVAMAGYAKRSERYWFDQAVAACFDYRPAYTSYLWSLRPRWGGSHEKMLKFGKECLATKRFDTIVPGIFLKAVNDIASELDDEREKEFFASPEIRALIDEYFSGIESDPEFAKYKDWYKSCHCAYLLRCGADDDAKKIFEALGPKFRRGAFKSSGVDAKTSATAAELLKISAESLKKRKKGKKVK
jgi:hypothetical protein